ncbi:GNAT family N-acetyltransferase [Pseudomonas aegrilactucae]|uniref:GNAT family N-acetyltransferase n=1 Tax=Pseudomonas aegrilactucae TaxID=2854028 RepID=A0A9Q2XHH6_9PSED|nr:GNAT family N-acetyltransferase [Pseudomonas aegrilactucae]
MSELTHRPVRSDDIALICTFAQTAQELFYMFPKAQFPLTPEQLHAAIEQRSDSTVVEYQGRVVGFANFYRCEHQGVCALGNVVVAPAARGLGVARYLVQALTALAFDRHSALEVQVSCFNDNTAGLLLYPQLGFVPFAIAERQAPDQRRVALVQMRRLRSA